LRRLDIDRAGVATQPTHKQPLLADGRAKDFDDMDRKFRRNLFGSAFALSAVLAFAGSAAQAGNVTGNAVNIALTTTVSNACSLVTSTNSVNLGDLSTAPLSNSNLATITETCNDAAGYTVNLTSTNAGTGGSLLYMKGANSGNTDQIDYTLTYNGSTVSFTAGTATLTNASTSTNSAGLAKTLAITTTPGSYRADSYADTLVITLAAR
jgi:hypothetical protein